MSHCGRFMSAPRSRRDVLRQGACGFGAMALAALIGDRAFASGIPGVGGEAQRLPHFPASAKSVIFLYMDGGPSQVDTFDPKSRLTADDGKPFAMKMEATQFNNNGNTLGSPWAFRRYGACGLEVSDLFRHVGTMADELCVVRSMTSPFSEHTNANYFLHTGLGLSGRPSMGAWMSYGLGSAARDLPGFVVLNGGLIPPGGLECFGSGFLPATHQGSVFLPSAEAVANIHPTEATPRLQRSKLDLIAQLDEGFSERTGHDSSVESAIRNYELAFRMQSAVPELMDVSDESPETRALYGLDADYPPTRTYALQCLLARRLVERGVRFIELTCPAIGGNDRWDQHSNLRASHETNARAVDRPIAGLLADLKRRGLLEQTLVVWGAEFGRTPFAQGTNGRDHNPFGFTMWMAGGGVRGGMTYGATDEFGYKAVDRPVEIHDLHATMLHLLGVDHTRLTVPFGGRQMRLTDVHGHVLHDLIA
ncbi:MAG: DUF1501 domain-containing protein [Phycisphaeraceae bacterium]|nr:DUF1501 domain-containing protein [Phycisphaeraceae bacterium]